MEDDPNGRRPKWKTTKMEDNPKWKLTQMEEDSNGRQAKWKTIPKAKTMFKTKDATPSVALLSPSLLFILVASIRFIKLRVVRSYESFRVGSFLSVDLSKN